MSYCKSIFFCYSYLSRGLAFTVYYMLLSDFNIFCENYDFCSSLIYAQYLCINSSFYFFDQSSQFLYCYSFFDSIYFIFFIYYKCFLDCSYMSSSSFFFSFYFSIKSLLKLPISPLRLLIIFSYLLLIPSNIRLASSSPTYHRLLIVFFNYNVSNTFLDTFYNYLSYIDISYYF